MGNTAKFNLGRTVITAHAKEVLNSESVDNALHLHSLGIWCDMCDEDKATNNSALKEGGRLHSVYYDFIGEKFWIITEADRSCTTVLLPEDY